MITAYLRPATLAEALKLLSQPNARPLGGGTILTQRTEESITAVDLQSLDLEKIEHLGEKLRIGAAATLSRLLESDPLPSDLAESIRLETPLNMRNMGTVAGTLVTCDGRSPFAVAMLALDARLTLVGLASAGKIESSVIGLGDFLPRRSVLLPGKLITAIEIPLNARFRFERVARTPADRPIVCIALAGWPSGRTRLAVCGWGALPLLALDGNEPGGVEAAARNACADASDEWASAEYRSEVAAVLAKRCQEV